MSELFTQQEDIAFYSLRSGEGVVRAVEVLEASPERPLDESERVDVLQFEKELFEGRFHNGGEVYDASVGGNLEYLVKKLSYGVTIKQVYEEFLGTDEARLAYETMELPDGTFATGYTLENLYAAAHALDRSALRQLEAESRTWARRRVVTALVEGSEVPELTPVKVFNAPEALTEKLKKLTIYRKFLIGVRQTLDIEEDDNTAQEAKRSIVDIYTKVVNEELAEAYPNVFALWDQLRSVGDHDAMEALAEAWPNGEYLSMLPTYARRKYIIGLDRIRNGTSLEHGKFSAITESLVKLAEKIESPENGSPQEHEPAIFTKEEVEKLSAIKLNAVEMQAFCKDILSKLGKLSDEPEGTYERGRKRRAEDGKWQVIIDNTSDSLSVNGAEGVLIIPQKFNRSLARAQPPIGAISGAAHEISHIFQNDALAANTGSLVLSKDLRGRSSLALREAGGVLVEQRIQQHLFGQRRSYESYYMHALKDIEAGEPMTAVLRNSYELRRQHSNDSPDQVATNTFDRTLRLQRYGGFDSQPLNYMQSALIIEASAKMSGEEKNRLFAEGAFDLSDMVTLHGYGLDTSTPEPFPIDQFMTMATAYLRQRLNAL